MISPLKYIQGDGELQNLCEYALQYSDRALLVASEADQKRVQIALDISRQKNQMFILPGKFKEECTKKEIQRLQLLASENGCRVIIGLGGGKALDTAKATSSLMNLPVIIVPTIAATDAPTSKLAIIYTEDGQFEEYFHLKNNPNIVLVDDVVFSFSRRAVTNSLLNKVQRKQASKTPVAEETPTAQTTEPRYPAEPLYQRLSLISH